MMKGSPLQINFEKLWKEGMLDWHGNMPERMVNDELEEAFWAQSMRKKSYKQIDDYAKIIYEKIKQHIPQNASCIEIGPGWGNYTFPLSEDVQSLTLVDGSESVLSYLKQYFMNDAHIQFVHSKWEEAQIEPHDVVIGVNCFYRMYEMNAALKKMNMLAKKRAIIGLTTGPIQPHYIALEEQYGYDIKYPRRDYIAIVNMLYQLGIYADCEMLKLERVYRYETVEQLYEAQSKKVLSPQFEMTHVKASLESFITMEDGLFVYRHPFYAAIISWEPSLAT
ncbi:class I SAM-dependent methyltransferase [Cytobacillus horneckiae]|uniref:Methyltransferase n=1 Tax=Cytobacillus horneckiae TaxID=549687 RepID=A0A2N0ZIH9_9BACI|nr:class I SAM-dependent methyltransferase [Cytobacillus horneckiae]MEC1157381.1 class I SAM-dependent methyltransferase [Cytobacillus horneckiae]MED2935738.1 class I SAM-dependent methyltransferase [Cytobacillus horneckiae]PKG29327.1 methyltransferase [Cytobacillus horneckiae]